MSVFNSSREVGVRLSFIFVAIAPRAVDVDVLALLDHALLHSADFDGPQSVFPAAATRSTEVTIKRPIIRDALHLLAQAGIVEVVASADGLTFRAAEEAAAFTRLLTVPLAEVFSARAAWVADRAFEGDSTRIADEFHQTINQWRVHFEEST